MNGEEIALRKKIVSLHKKGKPTREIAYLLDTSKSKAAFWIKRFKETNKLEDKPKSGRPTPLNEKNLKGIASLLKEKVLSAENNKAGFSSKEVLGIIEHKTKKKYSLRHIQRLLHRTGFSLITPRVSHIRKNEKAQEQFKVEFKKNLNRNIWGIQ